MTDRFVCGVFAALCIGSAGNAAAVEFHRLPALTAEATPVGVQDRFGLAVAADGDTVAIARAGRPAAVEVWVQRGAGWRRQATIEGSGRFGQALALQGDRLVIGSPGEPGTPQTGEAEVWHRVGDGWSREGRLGASGRAAGDAFGHAVALAGDRVLVGAPGRDGPQGADQGAIHLFEFTGAAWRESARLQDPSATAGDLLGASVAWSGGLALGGAVGLDVQDRGGQGGVLVFAAAGAAWQPVQTLVAADGDAGDAFGFAMAADAARVVVGSHLDDIDGRADAGSARVFARMGDRFVPEATLVAAPAGDGAGAVGYSVALAGDAIALGSAGPAAILFHRDGTGWQRATAPAQAPGDAAERVALSGSLLATGSPRTDVGTGQDRGVVQIARFDGDAWAQSELLTSDDSAPGPTTFGWDLAIDAGRALVGAPSLCAGFCPPTFGRGTAHFFERGADGSFASGGVAIGQPSRSGDGYAHAVALRGARAIVASGGGYDWEDRPAVEIFERGADAAWRRAASLLDGAGRPFVASDVAIDGDLAVAGNRFELHLFHRDGDGAWRHEATFPAGLRGEYAMSALALHGDTVALGIASYGGAVPSHGLVYLLVRRDGRWQLEARLSGELRRDAGFGDQLALHGRHLLVGESGNYGTRPGGGVLAYERTARGWEARGRLALPASERWHAGIAVHGDVAFAHARGEVHAFEFRDGAWQPAGRQAAAGPRLAYDGRTLLVSDFGADLDDAQAVEVFEIR